MQGIIDFFADFIHWLFALVLACITTVVSLLQDLVCWTLDQLMGVATYVLSLLDFGFLSSTTLHDAVAQLPPTVLNVFFLLGLPYCLALITGAMFIRLILQLIPFTRLGS